MVGSLLWLQPPISKKVTFNKILFYIVVKVFLLECYDVKKGVIVFFHWKGIWCGSNAPEPDHIIWSIWNSFCKQLYPQTLVASLIIPFPTTEQNGLPSAATFLTQCSVSFEWQHPPSKLRIRLTHMVACSPEAYVTSVNTGIPSKFIAAGNNSPRVLSISREHTLTQERGHQTHLYW